MAVSGSTPVAVVLSKVDGGSYPYCVSVWLVAMKFLVLVLSCLMYFLARCSEGPVYDAAPMPMAQKIKLGLWLLPPALLCESRAGEVQRLVCSISHASKLVLSLALSLASQIHSAISCPS